MTRDLLVVVVVVKFALYIELMFKFKQMHKFD